MSPPPPAHWHRILPGVYDDGAGGLHLVLPELLEANGFADTAPNRQMLIEAAREIAGARDQVITVEEEE